MPRYTRREFLRSAAGSAALLARVGPGRAAKGKDRRPNILFLMTDQHSHGVLGCAGNPLVRTPNLDRLARDGVRFTRAICATPFCSPARASLSTGLWPHTHGVNLNADRGSGGLKPDTRLTEGLLYENGFRTIHLGKWHLGGKRTIPCYSHRPMPGFRDYQQERATDPATGAAGVVMTEQVKRVHAMWKRERRRTAQDLSIIGRSLTPPEQTFEAWLADRCIEMLEQYASESFMITYSVSPPHPHWVVPEPYYSMYRPEQFRLPRSFDNQPRRYADTQPARLGALLGPKGIREYLRCYYGQVTMMDWCMGRILDALSRLGLERDTLVLFISDHGDMQGAHGMAGKNMTGFYDEIVGVPMIVRYPAALPAGGTVETQVGAVDVMPTLLDYAGVPIPDAVQGRSLRPLLEAAPAGKGQGEAPAYCEQGLGSSVSRMLRVDEWKYSVRADGERELFNLVEDPHEVRNRASDGGTRVVRDRLHRQLRDWMAATGDPALRLLPVS